MVAKLAAFALAVAIAFGVGLGVGAAVGPVAGDSAPAHHGTPASTTVSRGARRPHDVRSCPEADDHGRPVAPPRHFDARRCRVAAPTTSVELAIEGMTCASCAARIEKRLNRIDGVTATVNYATERARVEVPPGVETDELVAQVEAAGYTARVPRPRGCGGRPRRSTGTACGRRPRPRHRTAGGAAQPPADLHRARGARGGDGDGARAAVPQLAVAELRPRRARWWCGAAGRSTGPRG